MLLAAASAATALAEPPACQPDAEQVLRALNALRAEPRVCGAQAMPAAPPLRWDGRLAAATSSYAQELARRETLTHQGLSARSVSERMEAAGYPMREAGENLAAGAESLDELLQQWMSSQRHCENLMQARFREVALACAPSQDIYRFYWVLEIARRAED